MRLHAKSWRRWYAGIHCALLGSKFSVRAAIQGKYTFAPKHTVLILEGMFASVIRMIPLTNTGGHGVINGNQHDYALTDFRVGFFSAYSAPIFSACATLVVVFIWLDLLRANKNKRLYWLVAMVLSLQPLWLFISVDELVELLPSSAEGFMRAYYDPAQSVVEYSELVAQFPVRARAKEGELADVIMWVNVAVIILFFLSFVFMASTLSGLADKSTTAGRSITSSVRRLSRSISIQIILLVMLSIGLHALSTKAWGKDCDTACQPPEGVLNPFFDRCKANCDAQESWAYQLDADRTPSMYILWTILTNFASCGLGFTQVHFSTSTVTAAKSSSSSSSSHAGQTQLGTVKSSSSCTSSTSSTSSSSTSTATV
uniref:Uncharacterized protein n=1 Tax=Haptolina brevifila TaxID=156173 RepID=A0A7S2FRH7_9EUKA|mmetsp:Transcript_16877/g.34062  ORF Transcript_16877/g.34062 Transcript_16877/m.34062 type:complete len:371 (+) Transcript_16877:201-1313(+)